MCPSLLMIEQNFTDEEFAAIEYGDFMNYLDKTHLKQYCKDDQSQYSLER